ncbi:alpha-(1,3)-fucosyltransferase C-like [Physella acuta]|uniref:alpha-(1,3)-fucosyltransferase C-like n=1 Tax=Physella acuta TaxID=109671 RepID=UPI0027DAC471|nr:alpha-(1,3)-fucosyltransferase C-like [Physella acuta]
MHVRMTGKLSIYLCLLVTCYLGAVYVFVDQTWRPDLALDHRSIDGARDHRSIDGARDQLSVDGARDHRSVDGARDHRSVDGARDHRSVDGAHNHWSVDGARDHRSVDVARDHRSVDGARDHRSVDGHHSNVSVRRSGVLNKATTKDLGQTKWRRVLTIVDYNPRLNKSHRMTFHKCEYKSCTMTSSAETADLLLFNGARMKDVTLPKRSPNQIWLMYSREPLAASPFLGLDRDDLRWSVNWTKTHLKDSTFPCSYGVLTQRPAPQLDYEEIYRQKKYDVAWFVSHCQTLSRREDYVRRMTSRVNVHVYGACGNYTCGDRGYAMGGSKDMCLELLSRNYKFYLSFENSFCRDYISEKFFNLYPDIHVIPVVRGGADYSTVAPPNAIIDAKDFKTPEDLGQHLHNLARDKNQYLAMLKNKNRLTVRQQSNFACDLCKALHTRSPQNVYPDIFKWTRRPGVCWEPQDL